MIIAGARLGTCCLKTSSGSRTYGPNFGRGKLDQVVQKLSADMSAVVNEQE
jgi:hypothetical protein